MILNTKEENTNILQVFAISEETSTRIQNELEIIVDGTKEGKPEFTIAELIDKVREISKDDQELGFALVCTGRYLAQAEMHMDELQSSLSSLLDLFKNQSQAEQN